MATTWTLSCVNGKTESEIRVTDAISDSWEAVVPAEWDVPGGKALSLGQPEVFLANGTGTPHSLQGLTSETQVGDRGFGSKNSVDGSFPFGRFDWECLKRM